MATQEVVVWGHPLEDVGVTPGDAQDVDGSGGAGAGAAEYPTALGTEAVVVVGADEAAALGMVTGVEEVPLPAPKATRKRGRRGGAAAGAAAGGREEDPAGGRHAPRSRRGAAHREDEEAAQVEVVEADPGANPGEYVEGQEGVPGYETVVCVPGDVSDGFTAKAEGKRRSAFGDADMGSNGGKWTAEEDENLKRGVEVLGPKKWLQISQEYLHRARSAVQCLHRWQKVLRPGLVKGHWKKEEDDIITQCVQVGKKKWSEIAALIPGRIGKQCRERWLNHLDPTIKKGPFSEEEMRILMEMHAEHGTKWSEIAKHLPGRSENTLKNKWNCMNRRKSGVPDFSALGEEGMYEEVEAQGDPNGGHYATGEAPVDGGGGAGGESVGAGGEGGGSGGGGGPSLGFDAMAGIRVVEHPQNEAHV